MICNSCNSHFACNPKFNCWCHHLPKIAIDVPELACLCRQCLIKAQAKWVNSHTQSLTGSQKKEIMELGVPEQAEEGVDYTSEKIKNNKVLVFTAWYLLRRGYCCENGCRNCPYETEK